MPEQKPLFSITLQQEPGQLPKVVVLSGAEQNPIYQSDPIEQATELAVNTAIKAALDSLLGPKESANPFVQWLEAGLLQFVDAAIKEVEALLEGKA